MRIFRIFCWMGILLSMAWGFDTVRAQNDPNFDTGFRPWGSYHGGEIDHVSLTSGTLNVDIPIISYPQVGGKLKLSFSLHYENLGDYSNEIFGKTSGGAPYHYWQDWGPTDQIHHGFYVIQDDAPSLQASSVTDPYASQEFITTSLVVMPDGSSHQLVPTTTNSSGPWEAVDTTGFRLTSSGVYDSDGILYVAAVGLGVARVPPSSIQDANGNTITYSSTTGWTDTLKRTIPLQVATTDYSGCTGPLPITSATIWNLPGVNGGTYPVKFCYVTLAETDPVGGLGYNQTSPGATNYNISTLQSMILVNSGQAWTFQYTTDSTHYNDLAQVTFPTGGTLSYTWSSYTVCHTQGDLFNRAVISRVMNPNDGISPASLWTYTYGAPGGATIVTDPNLNDTVHTFTGLPIATNTGTDYSCPLYETQTQFFQGSYSGGSLLKTVTTAFTDSQPTNQPTEWPLYIAANVFPTSTTTIWPNNQQNQTQKDPDNAVTFYSPITTKGTTIVDGQSFTGMHGDTIATREYDYGNGAPGPLLRTTSTSYLALSNSSYLANNLLKLPSSVHVTGVGPGSLTTYGYDEPNGSPSGARGNKTSVNRWLNTTGGYLSTSNVYSSAGLLTSSKDPKLNTTTYGYSSAYAGSGPTSVTNALNQSTTYGYDFNTGLLTSVVDPNDAINGRSTSYQYDSMLRLKNTSYPDGGSDSYTYTVNSFTMVKAANPDPNIQQTGIVDGLGREVHTQTVVPPSTCSSGIVFVDTTYDTLGREATVSNPHCSSSSSTDGTTTYHYDALDRVTSIVKQDGGTVVTTYGANCEQVADEAGKMRGFCYNSLGQMTGAWEDPYGYNYPTSYTYDALDNLLSVTQSNSRQRGFSYDSLSRLTTASNPESGSVSYTYDANGNVVTKTDARGIVITYCYDALNRLIGKRYAAATCPLSTYDFAYFYDSLSQWGYPSTNTIGHLTSETNGGNLYNFRTYDPMGRPYQLWSCTPSNCTANPSVGPYYTEKDYDLAGDLTTLIYPSGRKVTYQYNAAMQPTQIQFYSVGSTQVGYNYLSSATYSPLGGPTQMILGSSGAEFTHYNNRRQSCAFAVGAPVNTAINRVISYYPSFGGQCQPGTGGNNGNVVQIIDNLQLGNTQTFGYDSINRLTSAQTLETSGPNCWGQSFGYDAWSNLLSETATLSGCPMTQLSVAVNSQNQITNTGIQYDQAGNMLKDGVNTYAYDAESRISTVNSTAATYTYDAEGRRAQKQTGSGATEYVYFDGNPIAEYGANGGWSDYIYVGSRRLVRADNYEDRIHTSGTNCSNCGTQQSFFQFGTNLNNYVIRSGDLLQFRQWQDGAACGGVFLSFTDHTDTTVDAVYDQYSVPADRDFTLNTWQYRRIDLSSLAGKTVLNVGLITQSCTFPGSWDIYYNEIALTSTDGTVQPIYNREASISLGMYGSAGSTRAYEINHDPNAVSYSQIVATTYYDGDSIDSERMMTSENGYPTWSATYLPFGEEWNPQTTVNHYKFTGKERDSESGLDNFGARYNSSQYGRFMTPDPTGGHLADPQTLNKYAYVRNNPVNFTDPTGLDLKEQCSEESDTCHKERWYSRQRYVGTYDDNHHFNVTHFQTDQNGNLEGHQVNFDSSGVHIDGNRAQFIAGTPATRVNGTAGSAFDGMHFVANSNCGGTCDAGGALFGTASQFQSLVRSGNLVGPNPGLDAIDPFHPNTVQYRGGNTDGPDAHLSYQNSEDPNQQDPFHIDSRYPYGSVGGFLEHTGGVIHTIWNSATGNQGPPLPQDIPSASVPH